MNRKTKYKGSICNTTTISTNEREQLLNRRRYVKMAIETHEKNGNTGQADFFKEDLDLINKKLAKIRPNEN